MAKYEFKFVVTDANLSEEHQQRIGQAIAEAGALALTGLTPPQALTVKYGHNLWWRGIPPAELIKAVTESAQKAAGG